MTQSKKFNFREDECIYCEFVGMVIIFENSEGEETPVCSGCVETALEELTEQDLDLENRRL